MRELAHTCHPRGSDEGLKAPTLVAHWRKPLPSKRGEPADAGGSKSLESHPLRIRLHCAQPHLRSRTDRRGVASGVVSVGRGLLIDLCRLFAIVPPGLGDAARVARFG